VGQEDVQSNYLFDNSTSSLALLFKGNSIAKISLGIAETRSEFARAAVPVREQRTGALACGFYDGAIGLSKKKLFRGWRLLGVQVSF
jgi:hypothetical protein